MFGFLKLQNNCTEVHVKREYKEKSHCRMIKTCQLRGPKMCMKKEKKYTIQKIWILGMKKKQ